MGSRTAAVVRAQAVLSLCSATSVSSHEIRARNTVCECVSIGTSCTNSLLRQCHRLSPRSCPLTGIAPYLPRPPISSVLCRSVALEGDSQSSLLRYRKHVFRPERLDVTKRPASTSLASRTMSQRLEPSSVLMERETNQPSFRGLSGTKLSRPATDIYQQYLPMEGTATRKLATLCLDFKAIHMNDSSVILTCCPQCRLSHQPVLSVTNHPSDSCLLTWIPIPALLDIYI